MRLERVADGLDVEDPGAVADPARAVAGFEILAQERLTDERVRLHSECSQRPLIWPCWGPTPARYPQPWTTKIKLILLLRPHHARDQVTHRLTAQFNQPACGRIVGDAELKANFINDVEADCTAALGNRSTRAAGIVSSAAPISQSRSS